MDLTDLEKLHKAVEWLLRLDFFLQAVEQLKVEINRSEEPYVWSTVDLDSIDIEMPKSILSCWIFHLKGNESTQSHYHPNSTQHMIALNGRGFAKIGSVESTIIPISAEKHSIEEKWIVIKTGVPHEFFPVGEDMTVVSFHTCEASELEEFDCSTGTSRKYIQ